MSSARLKAAQSSVQASWFPECSVCLTEARTTRFDCGHLVCCDACAATLQSRADSCPVCRSPISSLVYKDLPPVPGRQPTFESVDVALARLVKSLKDSNTVAQQEAAFALCLKAQEEGRGFERLLDTAGVSHALISLVVEGSEAARACAIVTLGLVAPISTDLLIEEGAVAALMGAMATGAVAEYAALAVSSFAEFDGEGTARAIRSTEGGYAPLVALLLRDDLDAAACEAACAALTNLVEIDGAHGAVAACAPLVDRLRSLQGRDEADLAQAAAALLSNVETALLPRATIDHQNHAPAAPISNSMVVQRDRREESTNCCVLV